MQSHYSIYTPRRTGQGHRGCLYSGRPSISPHRRPEGSRHFYQAICSDSRLPFERDGQYFTRWRTQIDANFPLIRCNFVIEMNIFGILYA